jgi:hypothetical protein
MDSSSYEMVVVGAKSSFDIVCRLSLKFYPSLRWSEKTAWYVLFHKVIA